MLSDIHRVTALIVESERRCGKIKRANKDLQNQCQNEKDKKSGDKLDKLKEDLKVVREENKVMKMELKTKERAAQAETAK